MKILKNQIGPGLLSQFIWHKGENYIEPQRQGTPKGEPIGFSENKYWASLLMITNIKHREIARAVGVSYGLLRKWNTEEPFKKMVQRHCHDFTILSKEHIKERIRRRQEKYEERLKKPVEEIAQSDPPTLGYEEYSDAGNYSNLLLSMIFKVYDNEMELIKKKLKHMTLEDMLDQGIVLQEWGGVISALMDFSGIPKRKDIAEMEEREERNHLILGIKFIKSILLQPPIAEKERKGVVALLTSIEKYLELKQKKEESKGQKKD